MLAFKDGLAVFKPANPWRSIERATSALCLVFSLTTFVFTAERSRHGNGYGVRSGAVLPGVNINAMNTQTGTMYENHHDRNATASWHARGAV
jgi:hypothetical protein